MDPPWHSLFEGFFRPRFLLGISNPNLIQVEKVVKSFERETIEVPAGENWKAFSISFKSSRPSTDPFAHLCGVDVLMISSPKDLFHFVDSTTESTLGQKIAAGPKKEEVEDLNNKWDLSRSFLGNIRPYLKGEAVIVDSAVESVFDTGAFLMAFFYILSLSGIPNCYSECVNNTGFDI